MILANQLKHEELHAGNTVLSSLVNILKDIEDIDDIGEDVNEEISEEINSMNSFDLPLSVLSSSASSSSKRFVNILSVLFLF